ncbi:hypothetical protein BK809_0004588 [Diplodia seriata]|uniref:Uncharacterized protein n=1 Tax=Diplodia seriata TaxID=420778 RepID=A0A1S8B6P6_9PEZI|nr:hypothetical protein BK809_0004588 [Diplodia seriata]
MEQSDAEEYDRINRDRSDGSSELETQPPLHRLRNQLLDPNNLGELSPRSHRYLEELKQGHDQLLEKIWDDEIKTGHTLHPMRWDAFLEAGTMILCSMPVQVLLDIMNGELVSNYLSTKASQTKAFLTEHQKQWTAQRANQRYQPVIYQNWLCDHSGNAPSAADVQQLVECVRRYLKESEDEFAQKVDTVVDECPKIDWVGGMRRYLESDGHVAMAKRFCEAMLQALNTPNPRRPFVETGCTNNAQTRLSQHRRHQNSNRLMNLVEAICKVNFPHLKIHQFVVYDIWQPDQAWAGEIIFDRLSGGWIDEGHGFTFCHAGESVESSTEFTSDEWELWADYAVDHTPFLGRFAHRKSLQNPFH